MSARWANWRLANNICQGWTNNIANKMPVLVQRMTAIWVVIWLGTEVCLILVVQRRRVSLLWSYFHRQSVIDLSYFHRQSVINLSSDAFHPMTFRRFGPNCALRLLNLQQQPIIPILFWTKKKWLWSLEKNSSIFLYFVGNVLSLTSLSWKKPCSTKI